MAKRTNSEVERDYKKFKTFIEENDNITSFKQVVEEFGVNLSIITTSIDKHPTVKKRLIKLMEERKNPIEEQIIEEQPEENEIIEEVKVNKPNLPKLLIADASLIVHCSLEQYYNKSYDKIIVTNKIVNTLNKLLTGDSLEAKEKENVRNFFDFSKKNPEKISILLTPKYIDWPKDLVTTELGIANWRSEEIIFLTEFHLKENKNIIHLRTHSADILYYAEQLKESYPTLDHQYVTNGELKLESIALSQV